MVMDPSRRSQTRTRHPRRGFCFLRNLCGSLTRRRACWFMLLQCYLADCLVIFPIVPRQWAQHVFPLLSLFSAIRWGEVKSTHTHQTSVKSKIQLNANRCKNHTKRQVAVLLVWLDLLARPTVLGTRRRQTDQTPGTTKSIESIEELNWLSMPCRPVTTTLQSASARF